MKFTHNIGGQDISIRRLTAREAAEVHALADEWRKDDPQFNRGDLMNLWAYANSAEGSVVILERVGLVDTQMDALERFDMARLALKACGFKLPERVDGDEERDGAPRPTSSEERTGTG